MKIRSAYYLFAVAAAIAISAFGQTNSGSIQGTVIGSDGTPLPGARIYGRTNGREPETKAPPTMALYVVNGATAQSLGNPLLAGIKGTVPSPANAFLISKLPAGAYVLCAQTVIPGWLDPCHWSAIVPVVNLAAGQNLSGHAVVMTKGAIVQVQIDDPSKLLTANPGAIPRDVVVGTGKCG